MTKVYIQTEESYHVMIVEKSRGNSSLYVEVDDEMAKRWMRIEAEYQTMIEELTVAARNFKVEPANK